MEVTIASRRDNSLSFAETKRDWAEVMKNVKFPKNSTKETVTATKAEPIRITRKSNATEKRGMPFKETMKRRPTMK